MVLGWRRAFCTSTLKDQDGDSPIIREKPDPTTPRIRFTRLAGLFSEPSTPRLQSRPVSQTLRCRTTAAPPSQADNGPQSPKLRCKTQTSAPSSPRLPSTFSVLKSRLRIFKIRCGICLESVKTGQGTAIFTAECGHVFHFPCISAHMQKHGPLTCPTCNIMWKEIHFLTPNNLQKRGPDSICRELSSKNEKRCLLKVYDDDEPLSSPTSGARFNPILESDETEEENDEFPGFFPTCNAVSVDAKLRSVEVGFLSGAAVVSAGKTTETLAVALKLRAPAMMARTAPVDLVTVLNVSKNMTADKVHLMRRLLRTVVSSLSGGDRLSIVAFSTTSKRLLPLRRMTTAGRRCARRIIDAVVSLDHGGKHPSAADALKKAAKVLDDRRESNPTVGIILLTDGHRDGPLKTSTRLSHRDIPVHSVNMNACLSDSAKPGETVCITGCIGDVVQDLKIQIKFTPGSAPGEISAVYSTAGRSAFVGSGSGWCQIGDLYSEEERELLIELKVPSALSGHHRLMSVRLSYTDPSTHRTVSHKMEHPTQRAVHTTPDFHRLKSHFVTTRAVAESRRMSERDDVVGAHHMLSSARALILQSGSGSEFLRRLDAELAELKRRRNGGRLSETAEPLTPTSAWRAAERLANVAMMRKAVSRVGDLHGFENARF